MNIQMEELSTAKAKALAVDRWVAADSTGITSPRIFLKPVGGSGIYYDLLIDGNDFNIFKHVNAR